MDMSALERAKMYAKLRSKTEDLVEEFRQSPAFMDGEKTIVRLRAKLIDVVEALQDCEDDC
jgi:hypothetical protein